MHTTKLTFLINIFFLCSCIQESKHPVPVDSLAQDSSFRFRAPGDTVNSSKGVIVCGDALPENQKTPEEIELIKMLEERNAKAMADKNKPEQRK